MRNRTSFFRTFVSMLRIKAIVLLFLFSLSSFGNAFEIHYCKGEITDIAFVGAALCICEGSGDRLGENVCHAEETDHCKKIKSKEDAENSSNVIENKDCCETEIVQFVYAREFQNQSSQLLYIAIASVLYYPYFFFDSEKEKTIFAHYSAPDFWDDIPIQLQRFLI